MRPDPWSEDAEPDRPRSQWGCAVAAIVGSIAVVIALIFVLMAASSLLDGMVHGTP